MRVQVEDVDSGVDDPVDTLIVQVSSLTVGEDYTSASTYTGINGEGSLVLQFRVTCDETYYGADCTVKCIPADSDDEGHYSCASDGSKDCLEGWSGAGTNCLTRTSVRLLTSDDFYHALTVTCV